MKHDEVSTEQLAANLEKQVDALRDTVAFNFANVQIPVNKVDGLHPSCTTLVDDQLESAHSREKAELQKALAARISEVQNLAADVAYEREKGLDTLNQLLRAEDMLKDERVKNKTQAESIGQCLDEIDQLKRLVALRTQDLAVYQKELESTDNRADDAEYKAAELERDLVVQRAWTWFFVLLAFVAAVVGVVK
jgi:hypothetical protein